MIHSSFMQEALCEAHKALENGEVPIGCVIVDNITQSIIARSYNAVEKNNNFTMHAEMIAINKACILLNTKYLTNCSIYITVEPCIMCSAAIIYSRINKIYYGANNDKFGAIESRMNILKYIHSHRVEIYSQIMARESSNLLKSFFYNRRLDNE